MLKQSPKVCQKLLFISVCNLAFFKNQLLVYSFGKISYLLTYMIQFFGLLVVCFLVTKLSNLFVFKTQLFNYFQKLSYLQTYVTVSCLFTCFKNNYFSDIKSASCLFLLFKNQYFIYTTYQNSIVT